MKRSLLRNDNEVSMRNAVPVDQKPYALKRKAGAHLTPNVLSEHHDPLGDGIRDIRKVVDVRARNDEALTGRRRLKRHERQDIIVFVDKTRRRASRRDLAENATHAIPAEIGCGSLTPELGCERVK